MMLYHVFFFFFYIERVPERALHHVIGASKRALLWHFFSDMGAPEGEIAALQ